MSQKSFKSTTNVKYTRSKKRVEDKPYDVTFLIGTTRIHANRSILSNACPYFQTMFSNSFRESQLKEVALQEVDEVAINLVIDYIYSGRIEISSSNVENLLQAAHMLHLEELISWCCEFLTDQLDSNNCIGISEFAGTYSCELLKKSAENYINNNILDVMKSEEFLLISFSRLIHILSNKSFFIAPENEVKLYHGVMAWVKYDAAKRKSYLAQLLGFVRLSVLGVVFLTETVKTDEIIKNDKQCIALMENTEDYLNSVRSRPEEVEGIFVIASNNQCSVIDNLELWPTAWRAGPRMPGKSTTIIDVVFVNDHLYVTNTAGRMNSYNPATNQWYKCTSPTLQFPDVRLVAVNGYLYAFGRKIHFNAQRYSASTNKWRHFDTLSFSDIRTGFSIAAVRKLVYIIGGHSFQECSVTRIERFDPTTKVCTRLDFGGRLMYPIDTGVIVMNEKIYIAGGTRCGLMGDGYSGAVRVFDPETNLLTRLAPMSVARAHVNLIVHKSKLYAVGGSSYEDEKVEIVEEYNEVTGEWKVCDGVGLPMKDCEKRYAVIPLGGKEARPVRRPLRSTVWRVDLTELRTKSKIMVEEAKKSSECKCDSDTDDSSELSDDTLYM